MYVVWWLRIPKLWSERRGGDVTVVEGGGQSDPDMLGWWGNGYTLVIVTGFE